MVAIKARKVHIGTRIEAGGVKVWVDVPVGAWQWVHHEFFYVGSGTALRALQHFLRKLAPKLHLGDLG